MPTEPVYDKDDALRALVRVSESVDGRVTQDVYNKLVDENEPGASTVGYALFESWEHAKQEAGLKQSQKKSIDSTYFSEILSEEQAYWVGFLLGDGWVGSDGRIGLELVDHDHVVLFKDAISSSHTVTELSKGNSKIQFSDRQIARDLERMGIDRDKTTGPNMPPVSNRLRYAVVRGLFDADGCVTDSSGGWVWKITSSSMNRLQELANWVPVEASISTRGDGVQDLLIYGGSNVDEVMNWIDGEPRLDRKYRERR